MTDHIYKTTELIGTSPTSVENAMENALERARKTVRNMRWCEVKEIRGHIDGGKLEHWQVVIKIGFTLED